MESNPFERRNLGHTRYYIELTLAFNSLLTLSVSDTGIALYIRTLANAVQSSSSETYCTPPSHSLSSGSLADVCFGKPLLGHFEQILYHGTLVAAKCTWCLFGDKDPHMTCMRDVRLSLHLINACMLILCLALTFWTGPRRASASAASAEHASCMGLT